MKKIVLVSGLFLMVTILMGTFLYIGFTIGKNSSDEKIVQLESDKREYSREIISLQSEINRCDPGRKIPKYRTR